MKIGIIGHFGNNKNFLDGQTIKTKILHDELSKYTKWTIYKVDTYFSKQNPFKLFFDTILCLIKTRDIILLLSINGMKVYFPFFYYLKRMINTNVYHNVIGGNLDKHVDKYPIFKKYLNSFKVNWVESSSMLIKLEEKGIHNCKVIPNFKRLNVINEFRDSYNEPYYFCVFSRIMKEKGIEDAINAIQKINQEASREVCRLDIYGQVSDNYKLDFERVLENVTDSIKYKGTVPYDKSSEILKDYFALLFPTYWGGEGFPGTIIDALSAGIPVICTNWNINSEIIHNKVNGLVYPTEDVKTLIEAIEWLIQNKEHIISIKRNCAKTALNYQPDKYIYQIINEIIKGD